METDNKIRVIAVVGPTASGKSALALELARLYNGEIVSCDSMQIYRGMNIGTAKPTAEELRRITHHMVNIVSPGENFSCADWCAMAGECIADIAARGKMPVLCGGTGLYLDNLLAGTVFAEMKCDETYRERMAELSREELHARLEAVDPESAAAIHPNNRKRVIRALEIYDATGIAKSEWDRRSRTAEPPYDAVVIGLDYPDRELLYRRIDGRVDAMLAAGLCDEVRSLDLDPDTTAGQAIGYKEFAACFRGEVSLDDTAEQIKRATRNYAKRQLTWLRRNPQIRWITVKNDTTFKDIVNNACKLLTE